MGLSRELIGSSAAIHEVEREIQCAARTDAKVLITGESGVGKEVVARLIHANSRRAQGRLVTMNCAGVPDTLLESELFGHTRGSFTDAHRDKRGWLELAHGGTVFMDEIGEMSLRMQAILLRFLESGEIQPIGAERVRSVVDVRIIAATNRNLFNSMAVKTFREDLYYRLNVIHVAVPPLRERREDIPVLLNHFLGTHSQHHRVETPAVSDEAMTRLMRYGWPGNVRQLKNVSERLIVRSSSAVITPDQLPREVSAQWVDPASIATATTRRKPDALFERMIPGGESFWSVVYEPFMARDLTREDLRAIIGRGLEDARGSYKALVQSFNLDQKDYKRFLNFLRKYDCHMPFQRFRAVPIRPTSDRRVSSSL
jgi:transcriptional regulator with PAS, ATPase and Fis domain